MKYIDRMGNEFESGQDQERVLKFLYQNTFGQKFLSLLIRPNVSRFGGWLLNTRLSRLAIPSFVKKNQIRMWEYKNPDYMEYNSYNEFFMRKINPIYRPIDQNPDHLIAVCDSKLSVYPITENGTYTIKNTKYTMESLLRSKKIASHFEGGTMLLFRLTVDDYHRYCYPDNGSKSRNYRIPGVFHTVNPLANDVYPIYKENTREFTLLKTTHFGNTLMMEVGALMVGKIANYDQSAVITKGQEKGHFEFGGSTIILCLQKNQVQIDEDIQKNSRLGIETAVKYGERIGVRHVSCD